MRNGFSVTALNNYLKCPWQYFYTNLLRIPKAPSKHQMYGTAMHAALKDLFDSLREREPDKDFLLTKFGHYLKQQPLAKEEFAESFNKGIKSLSFYFDFYNKTWTIPTLTEFSVPGVLLAQDVRLTGKLDKVEIIGDGNLVNVVDYKTGKPKTRGEIEGTTANSEGDMKRQLIFYKLLLDKYENGKYKMQSGEIDFVEMDEKGKHHKERFSISDEEVALLEDLVLKSASEILDVSFWNKRCNQKDCEYCELRNMMA
jgi:DNA helicase-2/ATP-dependent DNA helicase PcrA